MKLHADPQTHLNTVTRYGPGFIEINALRHTGSIVVAPDAAVQAWTAVNFDSLSDSNFAALLNLSPELVLLGTGTRQRFPHPRLTRALTEARIGIEVMSTAAACRTYNILMSEGRRVVAAFLQD